MQHRFLHLFSTSLGGAGVAAERLHDALRARGHESAMLVMHSRRRGGDVHAVQSLATRWKVFLSKARRRLNSRRRYHFMNEAFDNPDEAEILARAAALRPTTLIVSQLAFFLPFATVARIARQTGANVIWFPMDMAHMTGGCHYSWRCDRYEAGCGHCPALRLGAGPGDVTARTLAGKKEAAQGLRAGVAAASSQVLRQAKESALFARTPAKVIPLGVDPQRFRPRDKKAMRRRWGLPEDRRVIFFGARQPREIRKGMAVLEDALRRLPALAGGAPPALLIAGDARRFRALAPLGFAIVEAGMLKPDGLAEAYAAADLFVSPSLEDAGPMMINEAVMSGLPVVSFPIGVAPDLVEDGVTGRLVGTVDAPALAGALAELLGWEDARLAEASRAARAFAVETFAPDAVADGFAGFAAELRR